MKSRETAVRLKRFEADEKARKVADLEHMIREFEVMSHDLERQIRAEEDRTGVRDPQHFAYSTFAKSASQRRDKLQTSIANLRLQHEAAARERDDVMEELGRASTPVESGLDHLRVGRGRHDREAKAEMR
jgi:flagellar FliJ protein